ncbi:MAG: hypothetical protein VB875_05530, partial [Pirellulales bacterium]
MIDRSWLTKSQAFLHFVSVQPGGDRSLLGDLLVRIAARRAVADIEYLPHTGCSTGVDQRFPKSINRAGIALV